MVLVNSGMQGKILKVAKFRRGNKGRWLVLGAFFLLCFSRVGLAEEVLKIGGSASAIGPARVLGEAFLKENPGITLEFLPSVGHLGAVKGISQGKLGLGLMGRPLQQAEKTFGLTATVLGETPFVVIVHPGTGFSSITLDELAKIFGQDIAFSPKGTRVRPVLRPMADIDTDLMKSLSPAMAKAVDLAHKREGLFMAKNNQETVEMVCNIPGALGFSTMAQVLAEKVLSEKPPVEILALGGIRPSARTLKKGEYPISKPIIFLTGPSSPPSAHRFLAFALSLRGREILGKLEVVFPAEGPVTP